MKSNHRTYGRYRVTIWGNGMAVEIGRESLAGDVVESTLLQGDEASQLLDDIDGGEAWAVEAYLEEYI